MAFLRVVGIFRDTFCFFLIKCGPEPSQHLDLKPSTISSFSVQAFRVSVVQGHPKSIHGAGMDA